MRSPDGKPTEDGTVRDHEGPFPRQRYDDGTPLGQMILALSDEIEVADRNTRKQVLKNGERSGEMNGFTLYSFPLDRGFEFEADDDVAVAIAGRDYRGCVVKVDLATVVVGIDGDQGEMLSRVDIAKAENVIEKLLRKQLAGLSDGAAGFHKESAERVLGLGEPAVATSPLPGLIDRYLSAPDKGFKLNPQQEAFLSRAIGSQLTLLWGPPGCGKTMCIGLLAACLLDQGKRILLVSNTNKAVDGALEAVLETQDRIDGLGRPEAVVRLGGTGITDEFRRDRSDHLLETVLERRGQELETEKARLSGEQDKVSARLSRCEQALADYEEHRRATARRKALPEEIRNAREAMEGLKREASDLASKRRQLDAEWVDAPAEATLVSRLARRRPRPAIEAERTANQERAEAVRESVAAKEQLDARLTHELATVERRLEVLAARLSSRPPEPDLREEARGLRARLEEIGHRLKELESALAQLKRAILTEAGLVGTTVHKTFLDPVLSTLDFDAVIVDEASMVVLPMVYWAAGRAKSQVVVVGDFRQLPAIVKNTEGPLTREWMACSPFDKWAVGEAVGAGRAAELPFLVALQEQNRMHPDIGALVSELFYKDLRTPEGRGLLPGPRVKQCPTAPRRLPGQQTDRRIVLIDTAGLGAWSSIPFGGTGRFNPTHVALALALIDRLVLAGLLDAGDAGQVGYVTPYKGQAELFLQASQARYGEVIDQSSIGTAHRFQGGERDIMIFDYVLSEKRRHPSRFIDSVDGKDQPANLLNVALSRAKSHLVVIYNSEEFGPRNTHAWMRKFLDLLRQRAEALEARSLLEGSDILGKVRDLAGGRRFAVDDACTLHDEGSFYAAVRQDLEAARESVTIFSAFATPDNLGRWVDLFRTLLERGVRLRIVTKPPRQQPQPERYADRMKSIFDTLRRAGVVLDTRTVTHEKAVVVDRTIVWHGSLNMLSQKVERSTEVMTRTVSADLAEQLLKMLSRHDLKQNDPTLRQLPACPTCGGPTSLVVNWKGKQNLFCEQDCGFVAGAWDFPKLVRGVPIGRHLHSCPECRDGTVVVAQNRRGSPYARCNAYRKKCPHKEDLRLADLAPYEPYPAPGAPMPEALETLIREPEPEVGTAAPTPPPRRPVRSREAGQEKENGHSGRRHRPRTAEELNDFLSSLG